MSNNRNELIRTQNELSQYLENMIKNARKHGVDILYVHAGAPLAGRAAAAFTPEGQKHTDTVIAGFNHHMKEILFEELMKEENKNEYS